MRTYPPVVHDLQFGTYSSPHDHRGRHSSWPAMGGVTRSHGRRAGFWLRLGDRSWWCCLQRSCKPARTAAGAPVAPVCPPLPADLPPARTAPPGWFARLLGTACALLILMIVAHFVWWLAGVIR